MEGVRPAEGDAFDGRLGVFVEVGVVAQSGDDGRGKRAGEGRTDGGARLGRRRVAEVERARLGAGLAGGCLADIVGVVGDGVEVGRVGVGGARARGLERVDGAAAGMGERREHGFGERGAPDVNPARGGLMGLREAAGVARGDVEGAAL